MSRSASPWSPVGAGLAAASVLAVVSCLLLAGPAADRAVADATTPTIAPLADTRFDRPRDSTDATGLTLTVLNLAFTVRSLDNSEARTESGPQTELSLGTDVLFVFGKSDLTPAAGRLLHEVAAEISGRASGPVTITGYTDSIGTDAINIPLSRARAAAVLAALQTLVTSGRVTFTATGRGAANPVAPNTNPNGSDNPQGRAQNRRVEILYSSL